MSKGWENQIKKLEADLVAIGGEFGEKKSVKKLLEENDKTIQSLKNKLKIPNSDHPHTRELLVLQKERDELQEEVLDLQVKLLQLTNQKDQLQSEDITTSTPIRKQPISTKELTQYLLQVSLKYQEIKELKEKNDGLQKETIDHQDKLSKKKALLSGKIPLHDAKHIIWDQIIEEMSKMWEYIKVMEKKRNIAVASLENYEVAE